MNNIANVVKSKESDNLKFKTSPSFYKKIGIGQKRWGQLIRNEKPANIDELQRIAKYFGVTIHDLIEVEFIED